MISENCSINNNPGRFQRKRVMGKSLEHLAITVQRCLGKTYDEKRNEWIMKPTLVCLTQEGNGQDTDGKPSFLGSQEHSRKPLYDSLDLDVQINTIAYLKIFFYWNIKMTTILNRKRNLKRNSQVDDMQNGRVKTSLSYAQSINRIS